MERKNFIKGVGLSFLAGTTVLACTSNKEKSTEPKTNLADVFKPGTIIHSVYFWLKDDLTEAEKQEFLGFFEKLKDVPGISSYFVALPAQTTPRPVVDNSFSYQWFTTFDSLEDINTYENHPDHLAAIEVYSKFWNKVEVKDTVI